MQLSEKYFLQTFTAIITTCCVYKYVSAVSA